MKKIDTYSIDVNKALVFALISIVITILSIVFIVVPTMENFKISKIKNRHATKQFNDTKNYYEQKLQELRDLKSENRRVIESLNRTFTQEELESHLNKHLSNANITFKDLQSHGAYFQSKDINVSGEFPSPRNFFNAVKELNQYKNIINIEFPITIKSIPNNALKISFPLKTYKIKDLNSTFVSSDLN